MFPRASRSALTRASKPPFRFRGCLYAKRKASVQLAKSASPNVPPSADDALIIYELDRPSTSYATSPLSHTGLFRHNILTSPIQFKLLADATQRRAEILTERIVRAHESREELYKVVKNLDRLSDMLCGVIDLAELIRNTHPDRVWVEHAELVYDQLCQFMNVLNTHTGLYEVRMCDLRSKPFSMPTIFITFRYFPLSCPILTSSSLSALRPEKLPSFSGGISRSLGSTYLLLRERSLFLFPLKFCP